MSRPSLAVWGLLLVAACANAQQPRTLPPPGPVADVPRPAPPAPSAPPSSCAAASCPTCCAGCGPEGQVWFGVEYLYWALKSANVPPLAVQDVAGTPRSAVGIPGNAGQRVLFGGDGANDDFRSGLRFRAGVWFDQCRDWGLDLDFFFLEKGGDSGTFSSPGTPPLSRPFFNVRTGRPDAQLVSFPDVLSGAVTPSIGTNVYGGSPALRCNLCCDCDYRLDVLVGYRYLHLGDSLRVREDLTAVGPGSVPPGTRIVVRDSFQTTNDFHGGLLGLAGEWRSDGWFVGFRGAVGVGQTCQELSVNGNTTVTLPGGAPTVRPGGLLAQPSNGGTRSSSSFAFAPEAGLDLGYQVSSNLRVHVGYSFLYLSSVLRAGDQVDRGVDPLQLTGAGPGLRRPAVNLDRTDFWAQGVNVGFTFRY